jgi:hypothetical protein
MALILDIINTLKEATKWRFPLDVLDPKIPVENHPGAFGVQRKHSKHTGVDLYTYDGNVVHAVEPGIVVGIEHFTGPQDNSSWWLNTDAILVEGATGVILYGEIAVNPKMIVGYSVRKGEAIGSVTRVLPQVKERPDIQGHSCYMLHIELYAPGITTASQGFCDALRDPTPFLLNSRNKTELLK